MLLQISVVAANVDDTACLRISAAKSNQQCSEITTLFFYGETITSSAGQVGVCCDFGPFEMLGFQI